MLSLVIKLKHNVKKNCSVLRYANMCTIFDTYMEKYKCVPKTIIYRTAHT